MRRRDEQVGRVYPGEEEQSEAQTQGQREPT